MILHFSQYPNDLLFDNVSTYSCVYFCKLRSGIPGFNVAVNANEPRSISIMIVPIMVRMTLFWRRMMYRNTDEKARIIKDAHANNGPMLKMVKGSLTMRTNDECWIVVIIIKGHSVSKPKRIKYHEIDFLCSNINGYRICGNLLHLLSFFFP